MTDTAFIDDSSGYIALPVEQDWQTLAERAYDYLAANVPGWEPAPGNLDVLIIEALSQQAAEISEAAGTVPDAIFRYFGQGLVTIQPQEATYATGQATITVADDSGYTIPAGYTVGLRTEDDTLLAFATSDDVEIAEGDTEATGVTFTALEAGAEYSGLGGGAEPIDQLVLVSTVEFTTTTSGGVDGESDEDYLDRLSAALQLLSPAPILPADFALRAEQHPSVGRAVAINLYNLDTEDDAAERCVTVVVCDAAGEPISSADKAEILADLQATREVSFLCFVGDPDYQAVDVTVSAVALDGWDTDDVETRAAAALNAYLDPGSWGQRNSGASGSWTNTPVVRYLEVAAELDRVDGLDYISTLQVDGGTSNVSLTGLAPLTRPGTIDVTVTAP